MIGMWACSGSPVMAEIVAGSGLDWMLIDAEHGANSLESLQAQLQAVAPYDIAPVVRIPQNCQVALKQHLDIGAQNILVPMVNTRGEAEYAAAGMHYPPRGVRGVGSALARGARWNRVEHYLKTASDLVSLTVQVESAEAVENAYDIASVDGVDAVFIGPSDLAASMGHLGQQEHPEVLAAVAKVIDDVHRAGKPVGINAFGPDRARAYIDQGVDFILVAADVAVVARASEAIADEYCGLKRPEDLPVYEPRTTRPSY